MHLLVQLFFELFDVTKYEELLFLVDVKPCDICATFYYIFIIIVHNIMEDNVHTTDDDNVFTTDDDINEFNNTNSSNIYPYSVCPSTSPSFINFTSDSNISANNSSYGYFESSTYISCNSLSIFYFIIQRTQIHSAH